MIVIPPVVPKDEFEDVLSQTCNVLQKWLTAKNNSAIDGYKFEDQVVCFMKDAAQNTSFAEKIEQTGNKAFPDIVARGSYGVEVKKTQRNDFRTVGNSIFGSTGIEGVEHLYLLMGNRTKIRWSPYIRTIENIQVTHAPRFSINVNADETVFDRMNIGYQEFQSLEKKEKINLLCNRLYDGKYELWWLADTVFTKHRFYRSLKAEEKIAFIAEALVLFPEVFGSSSHKFERVPTLAMKSGVIIPNVRDLFTGGGKWRHQGTKFPRIYEKVHTHRLSIKKLFQTVEINKLKHFWEGFSGGRKDVCAEWIKRVNAENKSYDVRNVLSR